MVSIIMAFMEDSGLLPEYSVAFARLGSLVGISGEAVIPLSLGFGCHTRQLRPSNDNRERERFIVITILSIVLHLCSYTGHTNFGYWCFSCVSGLL